MARLQTPRTRAPRENAPRENVPRETAVHGYGSRYGSRWERGHPTCPLLPPACYEPEHLEFLEQWRKKVECWLCPDQAIIDSAMNMAKCAAQEATSSALLQSPCQPQQ